MLLFEKGYQPCSGQRFTIAGEGDAMIAPSIQVRRHSQLNLAMRAG